MMQIRSSISEIIAITGVNSFDQKYNLARRDLFNIHTDTKEESVRQTLELVRNSVNKQKKVLMLTVKPILFKSELEKYNLKNHKLLTIEMLQEEALINGKKVNLLSQIKNKLHAFLENNLDIDAVVLDLAEEDLDQKEEIAEYVRYVTDNSEGEGFLTVITELLPSGRVDTFNDNKNMNINLLNIKKSFTEKEADYTVKVATYRPTDSKYMIVTKPVKLDQERENEVILLNE